jgi:hypothetical protein
MVQGGLELVKYKDGDMLRRWVLIEKGRMLIEVAVVEIIHDLIHFLLENLEIDPHSQFVKLCGPDRDLDLPVVTVWFFTISRVLTQMMGAGKMGLDENIKHGMFLRGIFFKPGNYLLINSLWLKTLENSLLKW